MISISNLAKNFGGQTLFDPTYYGNPLVNALCVGVLVGTYSSIFVASPTLIHLQEKARIRREQVIAEAAIKK